MPFPLSSYISSWRQGYSDIANTLWSLGSYLQNAGNALKVHNYSMAGTNLVNAQTAAHATAMYFNMGANNMYDDMYAAMDWINDNWPSGGEPYVLDMDKILAAMWDSDKLRNFHFINYIDAMRASIWNTEIYEAHLAEWYRHFSL